MIRAYEEIIEFIATSADPDAMAKFQPSDSTKQRVAELIRREKTSGLSPDETNELNRYTELEHLMRLAKARAHDHLSRD